jgi:hypothetical protein
VIPIIGVAATCESNSGGKESMGCEIRSCATVMNCGILLVFMISGGPNSCINSGDMSGGYSCDACGNARDNPGVLGVSRDCTNAKSWAEKEGGGGEVMNDPKPSGESARKASAVVVSMVCVSVLFTKSEI